MTTVCPECGNSELQLVPERRPGVSQTGVTETVLSNPSVDGDAFLILTGIGMAIDAVGKALEWFSLDETKAKPEDMVRYCAKCGWWEPAETAGSSD